MQERRRKKNVLDMKKLKEKLYQKSSKKRGSLFKDLCKQENGVDNKGWRQVFLDFDEENVNSDDEIYLDEEDDFFSFLRK